MIVDDHALMRDGLKEVLDHQRFNVVTEAGDGVNAVDQFRQHNPDIVLMDVHLPKRNGIDAAREMLRTRPSARIVLLSMETNESELMQALDMNIKGYLLKGNGADSLNQALSLVAEGESVFPANALKSSMNRMARGRAETGLTPREEEILRHVARGESNKFIARILDLSEGTVKVHVKAILKKLGMQNRTQAAIYAHDNGLA